MHATTGSPVRGASVGHTESLVTEVMRKVLLCRHARVEVFAFEKSLLGQATSPLYDLRSE